MGKKATGSFLPAAWGILLCSVRKGTAQAGTQKMPCAIIASATFWKPTMFAPATRL